MYGNVKIIEVSIFIPHINYISGQIGKVYKPTRLGVALVGRMVDIC